MRRARDGFTLIELLMALALALIVITVCYAVLISTMKAEAEAEAECRWTHITAAVFDVISSDLTLATLPHFFEAPEDEEDLPPAEAPPPEEVPPEEAPPPQGPRPFLAMRDPDFSDGAGIAFVVADPVYDTDGGRYYLYREIRYFVKRDTRTSAYLLYRSEQKGWDGVLEEGGSSELLCDMIGDFEISYYDGLEWSDEWEVMQKGDLPVAVRIKLSFYFDRTKDGLPDTSRPPEEFYTVVSIRSSRYIGPEDRARMIREGLMDEGGAR
ncbi:MAG: hypothetical protein DRP90_07715 [Planctomycetota bacterium]|nr:MAG: hypothetical protein DRP90_07715 [Planctomycetota bacterium]